MQIISMILFCLWFVGRVLAMPSECVTNPLQRALADAIITMQPLDELRILLACGAKVQRPQFHSNTPFMNSSQE